MSTDIIHVDWANTDDESTVVMVLPLRPRPSCSCFASISGPRIVLIWDHWPNDRHGTFVARIVPLACDRCNRPCVAPVLTFAPPFEVIDYDFTVGRYP